MCRLSNRSTPEEHREAAALPTLFHHFKIGNLVEEQKSFMQVPIHIHYCTFLSYIDARQERAMTVRINLMRQSDGCNWGSQFTPTELSDRKQQSGKCSRSIRQNVQNATKVRGKVASLFEVYHWRRKSIICSLRDNWVKLIMPLRS